MIKILMEKKGKKLSILLEEYIKNNYFIIFWLVN